MKAFAATRVRRGMTLMELLVVIAIMAILVVTVAPNVAKNANARRNREGARSLSTFIAKSQSLAIGRRGWFGFALTRTGTAALTPTMSEAPDVYRGDTVPATLSIMGISTTTGSAAASVNALSMTGTRVITGTDIIRFDGRGPFYEIVNCGTTAVSSGTVMLTFRLRGDAAGATEDAGFQPHNTPFPPCNTPLPFEVLRRPVSVGSPVQLPDGVGVDMRWSGYGPPNVGSVQSTYRTFVNPSSAPTTIHVLFDGTGRLRQVVADTTRLPVTGAVFLLVGRAGRAGNNGDPSPINESYGANWQYPDSFWVAIDPMSGIAKTAECTPVNVSVVGTGTSGCLASQTWIRQALTSDGR